MSHKRIQGDPQAMNLNMELVELPMGEPFLDQWKREAAEWDERREESA